MIVNGITIEPQMVTMLINLVFMGWIILAILDQILKRFDLVGDLLLATLFVLVGLRYALFGMLEQDLMKVFLVIPFVSGALRILKTKLGRWRATA